MADIIHNLSVGGTSRPLGTVHYIEGTGTTAGTWLGSDPSITAYYDGLTIAYKVNIAGASTTTLNINGLGAKTVRRNTSNLTTHYPVNSVVHLTYTTISGTSYWQCADYDTDSDTKTSTGNTSSKIYLVGGLSQSTSGQTTYTHDTAYVGTDGCLYSGSAKVLTAHQSVTNKAATLAWNTTSTVATVGSTDITVKLPANPNTDTKNTAGSSNTSSKIYLVGATSQASSATTYSHDTAYVGTDGCLYSNSTKVSVEGHAHNVATVSTNGFMSAGDKQNLDSVVNTTNLLVNSADEVVIQSSATMPYLSTLGNYLLNSGAYTVRITFDAKSDVATNIDVYPRTSSGAMTQYTNLFSISTSWNTYSGTVVLPKGDYTQFTIRSNTSVSGGSGTANVNIKNIVLTIDYADTGHAHTVTHKPVGSVTFTGSTATTSAASNSTVASSTHTHTVTSTGNYTPAGTISAPAFTGKAATSGGPSATTSVYSITGVGSAPSLSAAIANKCMTFTWSAGSVPTRSSVTIPTYNHTHSVTASGTVAAPTFTGTAATISVSGTTATPSATTSVAAASHKHTVTANGSASFTGTPATITTSASTT